MEQFGQTAQKILELMGFADCRVEIKPERKRASIFIYDNPILEKEKLIVI